MTGDFLIVKKYLSNPLVTGTIFLTLAGTTSRFMGFFFRIFLNNVMGSTGLGLYQLVIPLMSVCMSLCCNGFQTATSKLVAEKPQNRQIILICAIIMSATIALLLTIIMYSNANYISLCILSEPRCTELVKALSFSILPAATQLIEQTARIGTCYLIYAILSDGGSCFKPVYSIYGIVAGEASATVFSVITIKKDFSYFKISVKSLKTTAYGMAALFIPLSLNYILASFSSSAENVLIPRTLKLYGLSPALALDIFGTISGLTLPVLLFPGVLCSCACVMLLPSVSEANAAGKDAKITKTINSCALFGLCFGLIFTCIFYLLSDFIGDFLFSSKLCGYFLRRLCFLCPLMHISGMLCSILHGLGKAKQVLFVNLLTCAIRILMIMLLVPHYGIDAYLWAMLVSHVFMTLAVGILTCHTAHK